MSLSDDIIMEAILVEDIKREVKRLKKGINKESVIQDWIDEVFGERLIK